MPVSAVAIFCEDIREEKSGQDTIVGTFSDNIALPGAPPDAPPNALFVLPKLAVYVRMNLDFGRQPKQLSVKLLNTNGTVVTHGAWEPATIHKAFQDSRSTNMPLVGFVLKFVVGPFQVPSAGKIIAIATIDDAEHIIGALNVIFPTASDAPPPP
jgi:hypothetical protein